MKNAVSSVTLSREHFDNDKYDAQEIEIVSSDVWKEHTLLEKKRPQQITLNIDVDHIVSKISVGSWSGRYQKQRSEQGIKRLVDETRVFTGFYTFCLLQVYYFFKGPDW